MLLLILLVLNIEINSLSSQNTSLLAIRHPFLKKVKVTKTMQDMLDDIESQRRKRQYFTNPPESLEQVGVQLDSPLQEGYSPQYIFLQSQDVEPLQKAFPMMVTQHVYTVPNLQSEMYDELDNKLKTTKYDFLTMFGVKGEDNSTAGINEIIETTTDMSKVYVRSNNRGASYVTLEYTEQPFFPNQRVTIKRSIEQILGLAPGGRHGLTNHQPVVLPTPPVVYSEEYLQRLKATVNIQEECTECGAKKFTPEERACIPPTEACTESCRGGGGVAVPAEAALGPYTTPRDQNEMVPQTGELANSALEKVQNEIKQIKESKCPHFSTKEGEPCSLCGTWRSFAAGILFKIQREVPFDDVVGIEKAPDCAGGFMSMDWQVSVLMPFIDINLLVLTATNENNLYMATFTGECRICQGKGFISGHWLIVKDETTCESLNRGTEYFGDTWEPYNRP